MDDEIFYLNALPEYSWDQYKWGICYYFAYMGYEDVPPTYIHSIMVAKLSECLAKHLIRLKPELFKEPLVREDLKWLLSEGRHKAYRNTFYLLIDMRK